MIVEVVKENRIKKYSSYQEIDTLELRKIKELLDEESLEYVSSNVRNILKITKENSSDCFSVQKSISNIRSGFRVILYIRLSEEDGDLIDGDISRSIRNQLLLLLDECRKRGWKVVAIFCEEGISGADNNRPEWNKSLKYCECRRTEIVLCKSQSRFSRSMEMIETYLHTKFMEWNIRFVGLVDSADTAVKGNKKARQINGLVNEWQVEDQSINTREILKNKKENGLYATAWMPYGYIKDPKDKYHLIIEDEGAIVVRRIFDDYLKGMGAEKIATALNEERILPPYEHMRKIGLKIRYDNAKKIITYQTEKEETIKSISDKFYINFQEIINVNTFLEDDENFVETNSKIEERILKEGILLKIHQRSIWTAKGVRSVIKNEAYTGCLVLGKYHNKSYKDKTRVAVSKDEWIRVPHCHEPIIDRNKWLMANDILESNNKGRNKPQKNGNLTEYSKKVYCMCCGRAFQKSAGLKNDKNNYYLRCKAIRSSETGAFCDNRKTLKKSELDQILLEKINEQIKKYYDLSKVEKNYYENKVNDDVSKELEILNSEKSEIQATIYKKTDMLSLLYEDRTNGVITADEFIMIKNKNNIDIENLKERLLKIDEKIFQLEQRKGKELRSKELFTKYKKVKKIDRTIINEFVDRIYVGIYDKETEQREIKIVWNIKEC